MFFLHIAKQIWGISCSLGREDSTRSRRKGQSRSNRGNGELQRDKQISWSAENTIIDWRKHR